MVLENRVRRICVFRPRLAEYVATAIKKGSHVLMEGELVSSTYERPNGKSKSLHKRPVDDAIVYRSVYRDSTC